MPLQSFVLPTLVHWLMQPILRGRQWDQILRPPGVKHCIGTFPRHSWLPVAFSDLVCHTLSSSDGVSR